MKKLFFMLLVILSFVSCDMFYVDVGEFIDSLEQRNPDTNSSTPEPPPIAPDGIGFHVSETGTDTGDGTSANPFNNVQAAVDAILTKTGGVADPTEYFIYVSGIIENTGRNTYYFMVHIESDTEVHITLQGLGTGINAGTIDAGAQFTVNNDNTIAVGDNENEMCVLLISGAGAQVTLGNNLTLTGGGSRSYSNGGGGVTVQVGATFIMTGGTIRGNYTYGSSGGGGVYINGANFKMSGGTIRDNWANLGGGVRYSSGSGSVFELSGGIISDNTAQSDGGGIASTGNIIKMTGGTIRGNKATNGGGWYINSGGINSIISGGFIQDNEAKTGGGIAFSWGSVVLAGGTITGNKATIRGGGVNVDASGSLYIKDAPFVSGNFLGSVTNNVDYDNTAANKGRIKIFEELKTGAYIGLTLRSDTGLGDTIVTGQNSSLGVPNYEPSVDDAYKFTIDSDTTKKLAPSGNNLVYSNK